MIQPNTPIRASITPELVGDLITTAARAPSLHNSQPWRFRLERNVLELHVDVRRAMRCSDPQARELVISCGAALSNLRLAIRGKALTPCVSIAPDKDDPLLLARITAEPGPNPTTEERRLLAAVVHRHTHRHGFTPVPIAETLASALAADVATEGARLVWVDDPDQITAVAELALLADRLQVGDAPWQAEIASWVDVTARGRLDGVPLWAVPPVPKELRATDRLPTRSFVPDRPAGANVRAPGGAGRIAVLVTDGDRLADWVAAGQALQRMLVRAAAGWVFATYATAPLEVPSLREALRDALMLREYPQMILELGHADFAHATPRLPANEQRDR